MEQQKVHRKSKKEVLAETLDASLLEAKLHEQNKAQEEDRLLLAKLGALEQFVERYRQYRSQEYFDYGSQGITVDDLGRHYNSLVEAVVAEEIALLKSERRKAKR